MANLNFDDFLELGEFQVEAFNRATALTTACLTAIAAEATGYSKQSFENRILHIEKLVRVQKIEDLIQLQSELCLSAYYDFFLRASRVGSLCSALAEETFVSAQRPACSNKALGQCLTEDKVEAGVRTRASPIKWVRFLLTRHAR